VEVWATCDYFFITGSSSFEKYIDETLASVGFVPKCKIGRGTDAVTGRPSLLICYDVRQTTLERT